MGGRGGAEQPTKKGLHAALRRQESLQRAVELFAGHYWDLHLLEISFHQKETCYHTLLLTWDLNASNILQSMHFTKYRGTLLHIVYGIQKRIQEKARGWEASE